MAAVVMITRNEQHEHNHEICADALSSMMVTRFPLGTAAKQTTSTVMMHVVEDATQTHYVSLAYKVVVCKWL